MFSHPSLGDPCLVTPVTSYHFHIFYKLNLPTLHPCDLIRVASVPIKYIHFVVGGTSNISLLYILVLCFFFVCCDRCQPIDRRSPLSSVSQVSICFRLAFIQTGLNTSSFTNFRKEITDLCFRHTK